MLEFHSDIETYFKIQYLTSRDHIIPYLKGKMDMTPPLRVLEVGCGEAGVLKAFLELGHHCTGIELEQKRVKNTELKRRSNMFQRTNYANEDFGTSILG